MKKVLIVIHDMRIGGAQKSLLSFLKCMAQYSTGKEYALSLMVIDPVGPFMEEIPPSVTLVPPPKPLRWLGSAMGRNLLFKHFSVRGLIGECSWLWHKKCKLFPAGLNLQQRLWHCWKHYIPKLQDSYDVAVSYIDGVPNYYVMDKVLSEKKVLWVHNAYEKLEYQPAFDRAYYAAADCVITISDKCRESLEKAFPGQENKLHILENITVASEVLRKAGEGSCPEFDDIQGLKLLSVGRLNVQKGFDMAIQAAQILQKRGLSFRWLVLGDGPERENLQQQIKECGVERSFYLLGSRENPYCYMKACDILVQPSRTEGKSIVLDEAKLLCKAAVVTEYSTVRDSVEQGKNGLIVAMTAETVAEGIVTLATDKALKDCMEAYMESLPQGNEKELMRYCKIML